MKTIYKFLSVLLIPSALILYSYSTGSPGGKTGSTGDGGTTCTQCHSGTSIPQSNWITTDIPVDGYTAGETYTVTVTGTHTGVVKMGFEVTAENTSGTKKGTWTLTDATRTKFTNGNAAVTHTSAGNVPSGNTNTWSMDWTAPVAGTGDIKFNAAVNAANGNGNNTGDQIYTTVLTVSEAVSLNPEIVDVTPDNADQGWTGNVVIEGNETLWLNGVSTVVFKYSDNNTIVLTPSNFVVNSNTVITATFNIPSDQQIGKYDVFVDALVETEAFDVNEVQMPEIVDVNPDNGDQGWTGDVTITGDNTLWVDNGVSVVIFKYSNDNTITLTPSSFNVNSNTSITASLNIPTDQMVGNYDVFVDALVDMEAFEVNEVELNPQITMVVPDHAMQGEMVIVEIIGSETQWTDGVNNVMLKFHDDNMIMLDATSIMVVADGQVNATFNIPIDQEIGLYDIYVDDLMMENAFTVDILEDIADNIENQISIYPVPADNFINIDLPENTEFRIVSLDGRVVSGFENSNNNSRIDISALQQGVYFVQIMNSGKYYSKKFIKR
ncbi:MAG: hypothetical protein C0595_05490 [Marinilabiliales bacterium]|nr:MAG: hypothetical protein C0595_05490 [Marinilabiliales bacterium]